MYTLKRGRFFDKVFLENTAKLLEVDYYKYRLIKTSVEELKETKSNYLEAKASSQSLRDYYIDSANTNSGLKRKRNAEKLKAYWKNLSKTYGSPRMTSILAVEYMLEGSRIRVSE